MSAKPRFKPRVCYVDGDKGRTLWNGKRTGTGAGLFYPRRVRVTDARDLTPEKAVEKVLQALNGDARYGREAIVELAKSAGMSARVVNGKVRVRRAKQ